MNALGAWMAAQRWFAGKARRIVSLAIDDRVPLADAVVTIVSVELDDGTRQRYAVPLGPGAGLADALDDPRYVRALLDLIREARRAGGAGGGEIAGAPTRALPAALPRDLPARRLGGEQSNTSVALGDALMLKHFRRLAEGRNPEEEIGRFLTERTTFAHAPRLAGHVDYRPHGAEPCTLAVVHELATAAEDGWQWMLDALREGYARVRGAAVDDRGIQVMAGPALVALRRLATRTAELHLALGSDHEDPAFAPERITPSDIARWVRSIERQLEDARRALPDAVAIRVPDLAGALGGLPDREKIRHHGDFHLGQTLYRRRDGDWMILDFEGEPLRPLAERRSRHTPLRDVAGMLRSIDYASVSAMPAGLDAWAEAFERVASAGFVDAYRARAAGASFMPVSGQAFERAVSVFVLEKAAYEVAYEASHRPDWVAIPQRGLARAAAALASGAASPTRRAAGAV